VSDGAAAAHAANPARIGLVRRIFSFPTAIVCLLTVLACLTVRGRFDDPDLWWHLKMGETIWTTHAIPSTDLFSYTTNHHAYVAHEWISQLLIYGAYKLGGYSGLMLWLCFFSSAVLIAGYALCSLYSGNAKVAFLGAMAIWFFSTIGLSIRPQMIGYLLLIVELLLVHLGRSRDPRWFFALPVLFALWVNLHGSFFLGMVVAGVFLFSSCFEFEMGSLLAAPWDPRARRMLAWALVLSIAALFLNPVGVKLVLYPFQTLLVPSVGLGAVSEWQPLQLGDQRGLAFLGMLGCIALLVILRRSELLLHELLLLAMGAWLAAGHQRLLFAFGILAAPVLSRLLANSWENYDVAQDRPLPNAILMAAALLIAYATFPSPRNLTAQLAEKSPVAAVQFIQSHRLAGPMLNEWLYGGYLMWAAPEHPVFIDGRGDVFEWAGVLQEYGRWEELRDPPAALLDKYRISFCLLSRDSPMAVVLPLLHGWTNIYSDKNSVIFVRSVAAATNE
jgi:hypothetical protein